MHNFAVPLTSWYIYQHNTIIQCDSLSEAHMQVAVSKFGRCTRSTSPAKFSLDPPSKSTSKLSDDFVALHVDLL